MKKDHFPITHKNLKKHLLSDIRGNLPGVILCGLFLAFMIALTGKVCPLRLLLGIPCPGCGLTRAVTLLIMGDLYGSLMMNPFLLPLLAGLLIFLYEHYILERKARLFSVYTVVCICLMVIFYVFRMRYYFPNQPPMIYESDNLLHLLLTVIHS